MSGTMRRKELGKEDQLNAIMSQVKEATGGATPPPTQLQAPPPALIADKAAMIHQEPAPFRPGATPLPSIEDVIHGARPPMNAIALNDVVQVVNPRGGNYGMFITVGGIADGKVHGFFMKENQGKGFLTVDEADVYSYGEALVLSREPVSREWFQQYGLTKPTGGGGAAP